MSAGKIYKQQFEIATGDQFLMFSCRSILDIQVQGSFFTLWYISDYEFDKRRHKLMIRFTGDEMPNGDYLKTIQTDDGLVWHIFYSK